MQTSPCEHTGKPEVTTYTFFNLPLLLLQGGCPNSGKGTTFNQLSFPELLFGAPLRSHRDSAAVTTRQIKSPRDCKLKRISAMPEQTLDMETLQRERRKEGNDKDKEKFQEMSHNVLELSA